MIWRKKKLAFTKLYIWTYHLQYGPLDNLRTGYFHTGIVQVFKIMEEDSNFTISLICKICFYVFSVVHYTKYRHERERYRQRERDWERERKGICTISLGFDVSSFKVRCFGGKPLYKDNRLFLNNKWYYNYANWKGDCT